MLLLKRKCGERIVIRENIVLTVVSIRGKRVKLGITAPSDVAVRRHEFLGRYENCDIAADSGTAMEVHK